MPQTIREMSGGGVDYSFECTGSLEVLREAFMSTHDVSETPHCIGLLILTCSQPQVINE